MDRDVIKGGRQEETQMKRRSFMTAGGAGLAAAAIAAPAVAQSQPEVKWRLA
jgi:TRAP-type mannitol/chloroaromatic compound transport system substrate-binding protein